MEIQALKLLITEQDLNTLATDELLARAPVRNVAVRLTPDGIHLKGTYQKMVRVPFETLWHVSVQQGKIAGRLADIKVVGFGAGLLKGALLAAVAQAVQADVALQIQDDTVLLDLDRLLALRGFPARTNVTLVRCEHGSLVVECQARS